MKGIVFLGNRQCEVRDFPKPALGLGEVLIRVEATGICGSDLRVYRGEESSDQIRGHEPCGVVETIGPDVARLKPGDRVTVHHHIGCGKCPECAEGEVVACSGGKNLFGVSIPGSFAEYTVAVERNCIPLPDSASFIDGAFMACVGGTAYGALRRLDVRPCESLAVFGLGPVGLSCVILGKAMGARVVGIDILPERIELGSSCGADAVIDANTDKVVDAIKEFSRVPFRGDGVDYIIETSGSTPARQCLIPSIRRLGKIAIVGVGGMEKVINPTEIHGKACTIIGSVVFRLGWMWDLSRFLATSETTFEPAVTHRFPLDDAVEAFQLADEGRCGKVTFTPHGGN